MTTHIVLRVEGSPETGLIFSPIGPVAHGMTLMEARLQRDNLCRQWPHQMFCIAQATEICGMHMRVGPVLQVVGSEE